ncbi:MAG: ABC transporter permease [Deltaproteobacteria bacterium]|nr:ABC transporter permease [Deltaproteobacteria bacterium]MCL5277600.1 ABC transporter permease [Deltaproteobacteria bacterium]
MGIIERVSYFITTTFKGMKTNLYLNVVTVITIAVAFLILNVFFVIYRNVSSVLEEWKGRIKVVAYLKDGLSVQQINAIEGQLRKNEDIKGIHFYSKEDALDEFKKELKGQSAILSGVSQDVLPAYFVITVKDRVISDKAVGRLADSLKGVSGISDVQYGQGVTERFSELLIIVKMLGIGIGGFMLSAVLIIVSNTIRMSIFSRKDEIEIMKLVGATNVFIELPFVLEGMAQVVCGTGLSVVLLYLVYKFFLYRLHRTLGSLFVNVNISFLSGETIAVILIAATVLGLVGALVSAGKFIRHNY